MTDDLLDDLLDLFEGRRPRTVRYVDSDCLIGVRDPCRRDLIRARTVDRGGHPRVMLPTLRRIWAAGDHDSTLLTARLLTHDWLCLDAATSARHSPDGPRPSGTRAITGIGITHAGSATPGAHHDPITVLPLAHLATIDAGWLYLLDPASNTVTLHAGDGDPVSRHPLNP